jgi:hypothetical protein
MGLKINKKYTKFALVSGKPDNEKVYKNSVHIILK